MIKHDFNDRLFTMIMNKLATTYSGQRSCGAQRSMTFDPVLDETSIGFSWNTLYIGYSIDPPYFLAITFCKRLFTGGLSKRFPSLPVLKTPLENLSNGMFLPGGHPFFIVKAIPLPCTGFSLKKPGPFIHGQHAPKPPFQQIAPIYRPYPQARPLLA